MNLSYKVDETDYLMNNLYIASNSETIKKRRQKTKLIIPIIYAVFGLYLMIVDEEILAIIILIFALLWFFYYPKREARIYLKNYRNMIRENFKDIFDTETTLDFFDEYMFLKDDVSESKIIISKIDEIIEIYAMIFIKIKGGQTIIIPKYKMGNIDIEKKYLKELADTLNIKYNYNEKWRWK
jgi:hypothetical protein